jgi:hypothetical protein
MSCIILKHTLKHLKGSYMFLSMIIIREHMQFLAEVCKMLKLSVKHFVRIIQDILVHLSVLIICKFNVFMLLYADVKHPVTNTKINNAP